MGKRLLLDIAPTGVQHYAEVQDDGDTLLIIEHTPTRIESEILDSCAHLRSLHQSSKQALRHAAKIPINTYQAWRKEWREKYSQVFTWQTFEVMKLNSRDNEKLRTGHKRSGSMRL